MVKKMLVIEDDALIIDQYHQFFSTSFEVLDSRDGISGMVKAIQEKVDIIIISYEVPKLHALEICKQIRPSSGSPIFITYQNLHEDEKVNCFEAGADDIIQKPMSFRELMYRITIHLKKNKNSEEFKEEENVYTFGNITMNKSSYKVYIDSEEVLFTRKEFAILWILLKKVGEVVTRRELMMTIWGYDTLHDDRMIDTHLNRIRKKMQIYTQDVTISTVWGVGYKIEKKKMYTQSKNNEQKLVFKTVEL
ncbi:response regulator transcription factor [Peribacillus alkalitolerans]|uniref:response regulator transcription factor n=1 Tax=Peribacillus alkalitolerans TaxID=1550385 RepID=UPI0013D53B62|nr:response regulator transcription factor [Peribacillus alkalitolerans]